MLDIHMLGERIKELRLKKGLTQTAFADMIHVSFQAVSNWERGISPPDLDNLIAVSACFGVSTDDLLCPQRERLALGVDGGGTKTEFVLFTEQGYVLNRVFRSGCNPNTVGIEESIAILKSGIGELLLPGKTAVGIFVGTAGLSTGNYDERIRKALKRVYPNTKIACDTDIRNVIGSATRQNSCIAAICGTGSVVYANRHGKLTRLGGWGYLLDQGGSGYDIGRDALATALAQRDGIGPESMITQLVESKLGSSPWDGIHGIYQGGAALIASFAPIVFEAYRQGDEVARRILERNAARLAELINHAHKMDDCENTVVIAGSVIAKNKDYLELLCSLLHPQLRVVVPERSQAFGACVQCCRICGISADGLYENFKMEG